MIIFESEVVPCNAALVGYDGHKFIAARVTPLTVFTCHIIFDRVHGYVLTLQRDIRLTLDPQTEGSTLYLPSSSLLSIPSRDDEN